MVCGQACSVENSAVCQPLSYRPPSFVIIPVMWIRPSCAGVKKKPLRPFMRCAGWCLLSICCTSGHLAPVVLLRIHSMKPEALRPQPQTLNPKPQTLNLPMPYFSQACLVPAGLDIHSSTGKFRFEKSVQNKGGLGKFRLFGSGAFDVSV